jgi:hypothetical protein
MATRILQTESYVESQGHAMAENYRPEVLLQMQNQYS